MSLFVDTSVWWLALRRDEPDQREEIGMLVRAIEGGEKLFTTGVVLQEILQGVTGPKSRDPIIERFSALPLIVPARGDHIDAAGLRNHCRRKGRADRYDRRIARAIVHPARPDDADGGRGFPARRKALDAEGLGASLKHGCLRQARA